ncbi:60S ribosomal protein L30 [Gregarina niphandrodes]|uniref:60S ribosomal protein L30 n=1 Tax=Gregarina niphandrodes TaxID=110365 RepID=A0A023B6E1_GRENI|nr:60S ribosomal protein L30 [Gregarina niphandrodes]EZG65888.1 60S ribosomal protein L30 [Gregarina niphandrodes]|eukprot:XP_011134046.1 60S ribosomal protein L30 [Gregarina niphandrodes]
MAKKSKKTTGDSMAQKLQLVMRSGKCVLGYKQTLRSLRSRKAKLVIVANNCSALRRAELEYYSVIARCGVHGYAGNNIELGTACGKMFRVGTLAVTDPGDSDIIRSL